VTQSVHTLGILQHEGPARPERPHAKIVLVWGASTGFRRRAVPRSPEQALDVRKRARVLR
jgi:hypothetical protein